MAADVTRIEHWMEERGMMKSKQKTLMLIIVYLLISKGFVTQEKYISLMTNKRNKGVFLLLSAYYCVTYNAITPEGAGLI